MQHTYNSLIVDRRVRWSYGIGSVAYGIKDHGFAYFLLFYYNQVLGLPGTYGGLAILIALIFDSITDPLVGLWSDNTRSRWGRRHPFMYAAAFPVAITYFFLWNPPELVGFDLFIYLLVISIFVRFFVTLYEIPSSALVAELTDDYDERTQLLSYRYMLGWCGGLVMAVLNWGLLMVIWGEVSPITYKIYGAIGASIILIVILGSSWRLHRYIPLLHEAPSRSSYSLVSLLKDMRVTLSNRNFASLFFAGLFSAVGVGVATNFDTYIVTQFWGFAAEQWRWVILSLFLSALIPIFVAPRLTKRWDKKTTAIAIYFFQIIFGASPVILRLLGIFPENGSPYLLPIIWVHSVINVTMIILFGVVQSSMLADVVEDSEVRTGRREEGLFFASRSFVQKATTGIGAFIAGIALDWINFPRGAMPGDVSDEILWDLGFIYGPALMLFYFLALVSITFYGISRNDHDSRLVGLRRK